MKTWIQNNILRPHKDQFRIKHNFIKNPDQWFETNDFLIEKESIIEQTKFLNAPSYKERIYCILNDIHSIQTCWKCNTPLEFAEKQSIYKKCCRKIRNSEKNALKAQKEREKYKNITLDEFAKLVHNKSKRKNSIEFNSLLSTFISNPEQWVKNKNLPKRILEELYEKTSFLPDDASIKNRIYVVKNHITSIPRCKFCNKELIFRTKYHNFCSIQCSSNSEEVKTKRKNTNLKCS